jgi:hypothetical protein
MIVISVKDRLWRHGLILFGLPRESRLGSKLNPIPGQEGKRVFASGEPVRKPVNS